MTKIKTLLSGWGNFPRSEADVFRPEKLSQISLSAHPTIPRGLGRSYGDAALNQDHNVILTERLNRFLTFDEKSGTLRAEAGVTLDEILTTFATRGWFMPVTPGTKFTTLGGCLAVDAHGKNHHADGTISQFVKEIELLTADGTRQKCSPQLHPDLFWSAFGGMGLTGIITEATLQLLPIETTSVSVKHQIGSDLDAIFQKLEAPEYQDKYSVAWLDCIAAGKDFGRGIVMTGQHVRARDMPLSKKNLLELPSQNTYSIPVFLPRWFLNPWSMNLFNRMYYKANQKSNQPFHTDINTFFYPLDRIHHWNRIYGKAGFLQYQFVLPSKTSRDGIKSILDEFAKMKFGIFLAVLKKFGAEGPGFLSFPREGYTLALDVPIRDCSLFPFLDSMDERVLHLGGRVYLAKDSRMKPEIFQAMYPRYAKWQQIKAKADPKGIFASDLSRRLKIEGKP